MHSGPDPPFYRADHRLDPGSYGFPFLLRAGDILRPALELALCEKSIQISQVSWIWQ